jgi:hypothetical protein
VPSHQIEAVLLGGGYGRGEGGVLATESGDLPYNDLEFYLLVARGWSSRKLGGQIEAVAGKLSHELGIEIELKLFSVARLRRSPVTMFYYDLMTGHRCIAGNEDLLRGCEHHLRSEEIPLYEGTRLLMNRCSGMLFAAERLRCVNFGDEEADFVARNIAKLRLALGDVVLTAFQRYHWSCRDRSVRLDALRPGKDLEWLPDVRKEHALGVAFKLHPFKSRESRAALLEEWRRVRDLALPVWLWFENRRLGESFSSAREYAASRRPKCPESPAWKNFLVNCRNDGALHLQGEWALRYPRERLLQTLPLLLWEPESLCESKPLREFVQRALRCESDAMGDLVAAYFQIWKHYN